MKKVKVGGVTYKIKDIENPHSNGSVCYGTCDHQNLIIEMNSNNNKQRYNQTLIHEIMHAVVDEAGLSFGNEEEDVVNRLSLVWYQVLIDNKFDFLKQ
jgi:Zn-dependent peptidase ImmA (M78 family)